jgi:predicted ArsR family transcriptional regulator
MTQTPRDAQFQAALGRRLDLLLEQHLGMSSSELAGQLGYRNESALRKVRKGLASLSAEKLAALAELQVSGRAGRISIDWLLTGHGAPFGNDPPSAGADLSQRVAEAPAELQHTIAHFLDVQEGRRVALSPDKPTQARSRQPRR